MRRFRDLPSARARRTVRKPEIVVKIVQTIVGVILLGLGALWTLQGANILAGSVMSGQSQWLYIGIVVAVLGLGLLWWTYRRRA